MKVRHHKNPLLKSFCPNIYEMFRLHDICVINNEQHVKWHAMLAKSKDWQRLYAEAYELVDESNEFETSIADELD